MYTGRLKMRVITPARIKTIPLHTPPRFIPQLNDFEKRGFNTRLPMVSMTANTPYRRDT